MLQMAFVNNAAGMGAGMFGDNSETDSDFDDGPIDEAAQAREDTRLRLYHAQPGRVLVRRDNRFDNRIDENPGDNRHWTNTNMDIEDSNDLVSPNASEDQMEDDEPSSVE